MTYPQDPYNPQGQQPEQPGHGQPGGYDASGYPQYDQSQGGQPGSGAPYDPYSLGGQPGSEMPYDPYGAAKQSYGQQPPPGYPAPTGQYPYGYPPARGTNIMAILSLVFAFVFPPVGIVLGHMGKKQIKETGEDGDGLATAGLVLGYIFTGLTLLYCCGVIGLMGLAATSDTGY